MTMLEILEKTRALIAAGWTQWEFARDREGLRCDIYDELAKSFCLVGAINRAAPLAKRQRVYEFLLGRRHSRAMLRLTYWNDHPATTKKEVLQLIDYAILKLKKKEKKS